MAKSPESRHCPECGSRDYLTLHAERGPVLRVALVYNRRCADCGITYTPPTPTWLAIASIVSGAATVLGGAAAAVYLVRYADIEQTNIKWTLAGLFIALAVAGVGFLFTGIRHLFQPPADKAPPS